MRYNNCVSSNNDLLRSKIKTFHNSQYGWQTIYFCHLFRVLTIHKQRLKNTETGYKRAVFIGFVDMQEMWVQDYLIRVSL